MKIDDKDLLELRKEIERIRQHEADKSARANETGTTVDGPAQESVIPKKPEVSLFREILRNLIPLLTGPGEPSTESLQRVPGEVVALLEVIQDQPKFQAWLVALESFPEVLRKEQLKKMAFAFRVGEGDSPIALGFDQLQDAILFKAFCQVLRAEKNDLAGLVKA